MDTKLYAIINRMEADLIETLGRWIRVPSVKDEAKPGAPFGLELKRALDMILADARRLGFETRDFDGYAGDIQLGSGDKTVGILCHADVVPAGDGWTMDPFGAVMIGSRMYGRGTTDDKGPAAAALFAMKAVKDAGIKLNKKVMLIIGCDEESGFHCMEYYAKKTDMPEIGFSPDAAFPVINTEKGLLQLSFKAPAPSDGLKVIRFNTGERFNVIPGIAEALIEGFDGIYEKVDAFGKETGHTVRVVPADGGVKLTAEGAAGHAAFPEGAKNAIGVMFKLLFFLGARGSIGILADKVGMEYNGKSLGADVTDGLSGALTLNLGVIRAGADGVSGTFDIRYPVMANPVRLISAITAALPGFTVTESAHKAPHHVPASSPLVQSLLAAYTEETGLPGQAFAIGGGTYARCLKEGVAFGSAFPDDEELAHQAGEYIDITCLMKNIRIFANAIIRLAGEVQS